MNLSYLLYTRCGLVERTHLKRLNVYVISKTTARKRLQELQHTHTYLMTQQLRIAFLLTDIITHFHFAR